MDSLRAQGQPGLPSGFTLIEVMVVVAIIALLVVVLLPSLTRAREQARTVKCLANQRNFAVAVASFATEHRGYGQLIGQPVEWAVHDPSLLKYDYQDRAFGNPGRWLKPWPVAYAKHLGFRSLRRMEQFCRPHTTPLTDPPSDFLDPNYYFSNFGKYEVFLCPSDKAPVHNLWSPNNSQFAPFAAVSYAANEDIFGSSGAEPFSSVFTGLEGQPWKAGSGSRTDPPRSKRMEGRMDDVERPSEVILFSDGGSEENPGRPALLLTNDDRLGRRMNGPFLANYEWTWGRLPQFRHSPDGGVAAVFADGSGRYLRPIRWVTIGGKRYVEEYTPRGRISPYADIGELPAEQP